jgi:hypothetical protein
LSPSLSFPHQNPVCTSPLPHNCYTLYQTYYFRFIRQDIAWWIVQTIMLYFSVSSSLLGPNVFLSILLSKTLGLRFSIVSDQVLHPYNATGKIMFLYIFADKC